MSTITALKMVDGLTVPGKELDLKKALPQMGKEVMGYFKVENLDGITQYIDKTGQVHSGN